LNKSNPNSYRKPKDLEPNNISPSKLVYEKPPTGSSSFHKRTPTNGGGSLSNSKNSTQELIREREEAEEENENEAKPMTYKPIVKNKRKIIKADNLSTQHSQQ